MYQSSGIIYKDLICVKNKFHLAILTGVTSNVFEYNVVTGFTKTVLIGTKNDIHFIADY